MIFFAWVATLSPLLEPSFPSCSQVLPRRCEIMHGLGGAPQCTPPWKTGMMDMMPSMAPPRKEGEQHPHTLVAFLAHPTGLTRITANRCACIHFGYSSALCHSRCGAVCGRRCQHLPLSAMYAAMLWLCGSLLRKQVHYTACRVISVYTIGCIYCCIEHTLVFSRVTLNFTAGCVFCVPFLTCATVAYRVMAAVRRSHSLEG